MRKILLATLCALSLEAQELSQYLDSCNKQEKSCITFHQSFNKAISAYKKHDLANAIEEFEKLIEISKKNNLEPAHFYNNLGLAYHYANQPKKAMEFYNKALKIYQKMLPPKHPAIATTYNSLGVLYKAKGENKKALELYDKSLELAKESFDDNHPIIKMILENIELAKR